MGIDVKVRPHHEKFFDDLKKRFEKQQADKPEITEAEMAQAALKVTKGNKSKAARLLRWTRNKLKWVLEKNALVHTLD
jgi:DNA-binding NtrC family response regulator